MARHSSGPLLSSDSPRWYSRQRELFRPLFYVPSSSAGARWWWIESPKSLKRHDTEGLEDRRLKASTLSLGSCLGRTTSTSSFTMCISTRKGITVSLRTVGRQIQQGFGVYSQAVRRLFQDFPKASTSDENSQKINSCLQASFKRQDNSTRTQNRHLNPVRVVRGIPHARSECSMATRCNLWPRLRFCCK